MLKEWSKQYSLSLKQQFKNPNLKDTKMMLVKRIPFNSKKNFLSFSNDKEIFTIFLLIYSIKLL